MRGYDVTFSFNAYRIKFYVELLRKQVPRIRLSSKQTLWSGVLIVLLVFHAFVPPCVGAARYSDVMSRAKRRSDVTADQKQNGDQANVDKLCGRLGDADTLGYVNSLSGNGHKVRHNKNSAKTCAGAPKTLRHEFLKIVNASIDLNRVQLNECLDCQPNDTADAIRTVTETTEPETTPSFSAQICEQRTDARLQSLCSARLQFCDNFPVYHAIDQCTSPCSVDDVKSNRTACKQCLEPLVERDKIAEKMYTYFLDIIQHFDCTDKYAYTSSCLGCQVSICLSHTCMYNNYSDSRISKTPDAPPTLA